VTSTFLALAGRGEHLSVVEWSILFTLQWHQRIVSCRCRSPHVLEPLRWRPHALLPWRHRASSRLAAMWAGERSPRASRCDSRTEISLWREDAKPRWKLFGFLMATTPSAPAAQRRHDPRHGPRRAR